MPTTTRLARKLILAGLPAQYTARTVRELDDHLADMDGPQQDIGDLDVLADQLVIEYRKSRFLGRHPLLGHVLIPLLLLVLCWAIYFLSTAITVVLLTPEIEHYDWSASTMYDTHPFTVATMKTIFFAGKVIPFAIATWIFGSWTMRSGRSKLWLSVATICMATFALLLVGSHLTIPRAANQGSASFTLAIGPSDEEDGERNTLGQLAQAITPLIVGGIFLRRMRNSESQLVQTHGEADQPGQASNYKAA